ncbi:MAG: DUF2254 domain-containing protein [Actinomycetota bacterium]
MKQCSRPGGSPTEILPTRQAKRGRLPSWRRESLRTTLWALPAVLVCAALAGFAVTYDLDRAVARGGLSLPSWIHVSSGDAGRQVLIGIAASVITVVGVVFSITILALTLASQQFGPRMLANFIRDTGTQVTLGAFVATFVYAVLALGSITGGRAGEFVPHISITVAEALVLGDVLVLIYFIHHIAHSIQLPEVIAAIARDLSRAIDAEFPTPVVPGADTPLCAPPAAELADRLRGEGARVLATQSGYLQFVGYAELTAIAQSADGVILLAHRPGHFIVAGRPLATVWPPRAGPQVAAALEKAHVTGPHRTLTQDPVFAIDQLVEIAIRALSPAVNDTFTALTCIDWLCDGLCKISGRKLWEGVYRDRLGQIRLIEAGPSYARMVNRAFDKIRQAGRGMPAVAIRQVDALTRITEATVDPAQRAALLRQADMILRAAEEAIPEEEDRQLVRARHAQVVAASLPDGAQVLQD